MTKPKYQNLVVVPIRADVSIGTKFKFEGGKAVYEVVEAKEPTTCCRDCALRDRRKRRLCASFFCTPSFRADRKFAYVKRARA